MAKQIGEDTKITLDLKTIGLIIGGAVSIALLYFTLQADIALAKELPAPVIDRVESRRCRRNKRNYRKNRRTFVRVTTKR